MVERLVKEPERSKALSEINGGGQNRYEGVRF